MRSLGMRVLHLDCESVRVACCVLRLCCHPALLFSEIELVGHFTLFSGIELVGHFAQLSGQILEGRFKGQFAKVHMRKALRSLFPWFPGGELFGACAAPNSG